MSATTLSASRPCRAEAGAQAWPRRRGDLGGFKRRREEDGADPPHAAGRPLGAARELGALRGAAGGASGGTLGTLRAAGVSR